MGLDRSSRVSVVIAVICIFLFDRLFSTSDTDSIKHFVTVVLALIAFPYIVWRTTIMDKGVRISEEDLNNKKLVEALESLASEKEFIRLSGIETLSHMLEKEKDNQTFKDKISKVMHNFLQSESRSIIDAYFHDNSPGERDSYHQEKSNLLTGSSHAIHPFGGCSSKQIDSGIKCPNSPVSIKVEKHKISFYLSQFATVLELLCKYNKDKEFDLQHVWLASISCRDMNLSKISFPRAYMKWADLRNCNFRKSNLSNSFLMYANLTGANLEETDLTDAQLTHANLTGANLTDAEITGANLTDAEITGADFSGANLTGANISTHKIQGYIKESCRWEKCRYNSRLFLDDNNRWHHPTSFPDGVSPEMFDMIDVSEEIKHANNEDAPNVLSIVMLEDYTPDRIEYMHAPIYKEGIQYQEGVSISKELLLELIDKGKARQR